MTKTPIEWTRRQRARVAEHPEQGAIVIGSLTATKNFQYAGTMERNRAERVVAFAMLLELGVDPHHACNLLFTEKPIPTGSVGYDA